MFASLVNKLYETFRLEHYRTLFGNIKEKDGSLSATEAFAVDVIYLLKNPTIKQLSKTLGISQPNATYKVNNLVAKGYVRREESEDDKRESRVSVCDKFFKYYDINSQFVRDSEKKVREKFSSDEIDIFCRVLNCIIEKED